MMCTNLQHPSVLAYARTAPLYGKRGALGQCAYFLSLANSARRLMSASGICRRKGRLCHPFLPPPLSLQRGGGAAFLGKFLRFCGFAAKYHPQLWMVRRISAGRWSHPPPSCNGGVCGRTENTVFRPPFTVSGRQYFAWCVQTGNTPHPPHMRRGLPSMERGEPCESAQKFVATNASPFSVKGRCHGVAVTEGYAAGRKTKIFLPASNSPCLSLSGAAFCGKAAKPENLHGG